MIDNIDFVVTWVDGSDKNWLSKKNKYYSSKISKMNSDKAYRDWKTFKYWFRGVATYAPWVHKIYLVTDNQIPDWLNIDNPQIEVIDHKDYLPHDALPVFNTNAITVNMHKIPNLSEKFVYFNDDMYLINPVRPKDFFLNDLPRDMAVFQPINPEEYGTAHFQVNNMAIINKYFSKKTILKQSKIFSWKYGIQNIRSCLFMNNNFNPGFFETHLPESFLKTTFNEVWDREKALLNKTMYSRFRSDTDTSEWLFRDWQLAQGKFKPRNNCKFGKLTSLSNNNDKIFNLMASDNLKVLCINDSFDLDNEDQIMQDFISEFEKKFPKKSKFEI